MVPPDRDCFPIHSRELRLSAIPPRSLLIPGGDLQDRAFLEWAADNLQSNRLSRASKSTANADSRMAGYVKRNRAQTPGTTARVAQRDLFTVDIGHSATTLLDLRRRDRYRRNDHIDSLERALKFLGEQTAHALGSDITSSRKH